MNPRLRRPAVRLALLAVFVCLAGCRHAPIAPVITVNNGPNAPQQESKPYVVLVSLDGFRYDYARRYDASHILAMESEGASAPDGMIPSYPSLTFPNHYTIVTGLYPEHHGIVANVFYDPARKQVYSFRDPRTVTDGSWYGGTPLWVLAEEQGMRSACFFWPGSEADIQGMYPSYYLKYDSRFPNAKRVQQVLTWLELPAARRPHFITVYFSDTDSAGHQYGPDSPQVAAAVQEVDHEVGELLAGVQRTKLAVDVIVLADHGMAQIQGDWIDLAQFVPASDFEKITGSLLYPRSEADAKQAFKALSGKSDQFVVYRRAEVPPNLHFDSNPRSGDPVVVATGPYAIRFAPDPKRPNEKPEPGNHGFDPARVAEMKASFFAEGPDIRKGATVPAFENVNVYPLIAKILGLDITKLKTGPIDGSITVLQPILTNPN